MQNDYGDILFLIVIAFCLIYVLLDMKFTNSEETKKYTKPIIRHCMNCEYHEKYLGCNPNCTVKYQICFHPRLKALFCRYYKAKGGGKNAE